MGVDAAGLAKPMLRRLRAELAKAYNVPPYVIFPDRTLTEMALIRPHTSSQLLEISGVGQTKLERYGDEFLGAISNAAG